jgi:hypothetical protein
MHISLHRATTSPDGTLHAAALEQTIKAARGPEPSSLTPEEIRKIVLDVLG